MDSSHAPNEREDNDHDSNEEQNDAAGGEERRRSEGAAPQPTADPGCLSNTRDPSSLIEIETEGCQTLRVSGGIDWFEWFAYYNWEDTKTFEAAIALFQAAKKRCQEKRIPFVEVIVPGYGPVRVHRHGFNRGGDRGQHYEYKIDIGGAMLGVATRNVTPQQAEHAIWKRQPNVAYQQTGRHCLLVGVYEGYERAQAFLSAIGGRRLKECLSRVDLCLDIPDLPVQELLALVERHCVITRATTVRPHENLLNGERSGFSAGKSPLYLTVYDKVREQFGKADALYLQALEQRRWGGRFPTTAARIEYQLGRNKLRDLNIDSPSDFLNQRGRLTGYLTDEWFRLTAEPVDSENKHQSRATVHPLWQSIQKAFAAIFGPPEAPLPPLDRTKVEPIQLAAQARGCLLGCLLQMGVEFSSYSQFATKAGDLLFSLFLSPEGRQEFMYHAHKRRMDFEG
ncbi:replication initiation factor domain-containing protein [Botrimarina mediterranea]|uniref:Replication initiation factor n=1 Tax=Botrimarina mediterranea TaxID=2528022 RepID=A0A518K7P7_9BACT|nr:replication initiation factor domain-containing protein [Botrimarina mediterranea]QDV73805.1 Replication initiation factor [Botrimarina mediterranea]